jgi:hypothetical protein
MMEWRYSSLHFEPFLYIENGELHSRVALPPGEKAPGTHWIEVWVGPRFGLGAVEKRKYLAPTPNHQLSSS